MELSEKLEHIADLSREAASATDTKRLLEGVAKTARRVFACRSVAVVLVSEESELLSVRASAGLSEEFIRDFRRPVGTGVIAEVMWEGSNLLYDRLPDDAPERDDLRFEHDPTSLMCVGLEIDSRAIGFILCESDVEAAFAEDDLRLLKIIAEIAALAHDRENVRRVSRKLIMIDQLTQVYSYAYFHRRFTEEVERAQRLSERLSVLLLEVDNLKDYRETHGWQATERVLRDIAKLVGESVRNIDVVGRYGVDEIILYLPETPREKAVLAAERVRLLVEKDTHATDPALTVSIGLASLPENGDTVNRLLESVTSALLAAQRAGRNRVETAGIS